MEPSPAPAIAAATTTATTTTTATYPESIDSSPRSRATDVDDAFTTTAVGGGKLRLMCSYGGHIVPRPNDKCLCYVGGDSRIVVVDRSCTLNDLLSRLSKNLLNGQQFTLKYQLPNEDLDSLITLSTEEDLDNMIDEYERLISANSNQKKSSRIRLFLFPSKPEGTNSIGSILDGSNRSEDWFFNALNGSAALQRGFSDPNSVNCLLGLDENGNNSVNPNQSNPDVNSVPDSPIIETNSSFGSTSSSPSVANFPPIRVLEQRVGVGSGIGIEEQFAQMGVSVQKQDEGSFVLSSPPSTAPSNMAAAPMMMTGVPAAMASGEIANWVLSDDDRSDRGVQAGCRKQEMGQPVMTSQAQQQQKQQSELPFPVSVSSDSSLSNAVSRQNPVIYQDQVGQLSSGSNTLPQNLVDLNTQIQMQQVSETVYAFPPQFDQHQQQQLLQHQQQQLLQHQQHLHQLQPQGHQYIPAGAHFVHHQPAGAVPLSTYYPLYPPQQPHHHPHQYPVYYLPAGQAQAYSLPGQQHDLGEAANSIPSSRPQTPPNPTIITTPSKPDMAAGVYRTATSAGGPQLVHISSSQRQNHSQPQMQQQFMGYSHIHQPSQSTATNSAAPAGYSYEFADPSHAQIYYTQPLAPTLATQYQAAGLSPDVSSQLQNDNLK